MFPHLSRAYARGDQRPLRWIYGLSGLVLFVIVPALCRAERMTGAPISGWAIPLVPLVLLGVSWGLDRALAIRDRG